ncbi:MAG: Transcriptional regulatory protein FixJ [Candidatus Accumulibacter appositus]|uniref:Transcriptional regulatory protein FixJ n=1 Tax=Candidatus Accumulibacter appositus TaxID=1454003 RepID=A0A011QQG8_9PROT|nr:response regulator [Accumulibacter sp.]EXI81139.1 MAG: Transcriptional regulatory protein FixJ [Candidatus Accumulibacter appositus]HRF04616.1 response regulator [Accumulibacter sp.]
MTPHAYLVDDDDAIRDSLGWLLESRGVPCLSYPSAEDFLAAWNTSLPGCILLDIRMDGMSGPELFDLLCQRGSTLPVIFLTGHGDVPMAVSALKQGAFDFVEKPCNDNELVNRVIEALQLDENQRLAAADSDSVNSLTSRLTTREKQVMDLVLAGTLNKVITDELQISMRTVEVHRANLFEKMGVRTAVELAQLLAGKR